MQTGCIPINTKSKRLYLATLAEGWSHVKAAKITGISPKKWIRYRKKNPTFEKRCEEAVEYGVSVLEDAAHRRAVNGTLKPIVNQGRIVTFVREYSDGLLNSALKARSKKYATATAAGANFEDTYAGAAEQLQSRLTDLFDSLEAERIEGIKMAIR